MNNTPTLTHSKTQWNLQHLTVALQRSLPGKSRQPQMVPTQGHLYQTMRPNPRKAAVLVLFFNYHHEINLLFTQRTLKLRHHKGQMCFPGGRYEESDQNFVNTALRETTEELGIPSRYIKILGHLTSLYIPRSHNLVYPIVGWLTELPKLTPNTDEVAQVIFTPLRVLLDPTSTSTYVYQIDQQSATTPCYRVNEICIWGATAMITRELLDIIKRLPQLMKRELPVLSSHRASLR